MGDRLSVRRLALLAAAGFLVAGLLGFVPGATTHYGDLAFAGHGSQAKLVGVFQVSILLNLVHLAFAVAGALLGRSPAGARTYLGAGGIASLVLWVVGVSGGGGFIPVDRADNWLHFAAGIGMIGLGYAGSREAPAAAPA
jgi:hypothetical protein